MAFKRVNVSLTPELHERTQALADRLPGSNVSEIIRESLENTLPILEIAASAMEKNMGDRQEAQKVYVNDLVEHTLRKVFEMDMEGVNGA